MTPTGGTPPEGWQVTALVRAKEPDEPTDPADPSELEPPPPWRDAAADVRSVVKWLVGAFAAVGTVMFAKGFVTTPALSWQTDRVQLVSAWAAGVLGLLALGWLIYQAVNVLRPALYELADLPAAYKKHIDANPRYYLPSDVDSIDQFTARLEALRQNEATSRVALENCRQACEAATGQKPTDQAIVADAKEALSRQIVTHASLERNLIVYNGTRGRLLDRAVYWKSSKGLDTSGALMVCAAVAAAAGGIGYQLLLATPPTPDQGSGSTPPVVGELVRVDSDAGKLLWAQLELAGCQSKEDTPRIPVAVSGGKGTPTDPYVVSTLPTKTCHATTFTVINEVGRVSVPTPLTITYIPAPDGATTATP